MVSETESMDVLEKNVAALDNKELRDHFIYFTHTEAMNPSTNICAGVRWLFQKKAGAKERYAKIDPNHTVTWDDAVAEYKGVLGEILDKENTNPDPEHKMPTFRGIYNKFKEPSI